MQYHCYSPAVSILISPLNDLKEKFFLTMSDDYSMGKLVRNGVEEVHCREPDTDFKIADASQSREKIRSLENHENAFDRWFGQIYERFFQGGHGNIGMNNWGVAYLNEPPEKAKFIVPTNEPVFERIYPSFIKYMAVDPKTNQVRTNYEICDILYFYEGQDRNDLVEYDWLATNVIDPRSDDREVNNNQIYLPVWEDSLSGVDLKLIDYMESGNIQRLDYERLKVRFKKLERRSESQTIDIANITPVHAEKFTLEGLEGWNVRLKPFEPEGVKFAFFGIPCHDAQTKLTRGTLPPWGGLAPYFYDLRHLYDLGQIKNENVEFYFFEHALKNDHYEGTRELISGKPLVIDVDNLLSLMNRADAGIRRKVKEFKNNPATLRNWFAGNGYQELAHGPLQTGRYRLDLNGTHIKKIEIMPFRNVYPYSFVGTFQITINGIRLNKEHSACAEFLKKVTSKDGNEELKLLMFAVSHGASGIRGTGNEPMRSLHANEEYRLNLSGHLRPGLTLEEAIEKIKERLIGEFRFAGLQRMEITFERLLLLDQGADVHHWTKYGGLNYLVGTNRPKISSELFVAAKKFPLFDERDFIDPRGFVLKLRDENENAVFRFIHDQISGNRLELLSQYDEKLLVSEAFLLGLAAELNKLLNDSSFYQKDRFQKFQLSDKIEEMIARLPLKGDDLRSLNRLLLELVFREQIAQWATKKSEK